MIEVPFSYDARGYTHILYYYYEEVAELVLDSVRAFYDRQAKVTETADPDGDCDWYALIFWTAHPFGELYKHTLRQVYDPDLGDFNNLGKQTRESTP